MKLFGFGGQSAPDPAKQARDEASQESIRNGGLPLNAIDRLSEQQRRERDGKPFFTSDLSPNELLLTHQCGFTPLGQVMGSCVYNVGWQWIQPQNMVWDTQSIELDILTESQVNARRLAFSRLAQEAKLLGADGVVGVRFTRQESDFGSRQIEFKAIGTAVRRMGAPPLLDGHEPFVSNLSGQDHWMLRQAGMAPLGFVFGTSARTQRADWRSQGAMMSWSNAELPFLTQLAYTTREMAMERMGTEARRLGASGIVGVDFAMHREFPEQQGQQGVAVIMHFTAWGTAIGPDASAALPKRNPITPVLQVGP